MIVYNRIHFPSSDRMISAKIFCTLNVLRKTVNALVFCLSSSHVHIVGYYVYKYIQFSNVRAPYFAKKLSLRLAEMCKTKQKNICKTFYRCFSVQRV